MSFPLIFISIYLSGCFLPQLPQYKTARDKGKSTLARVKLNPIAMKIGEHFRLYGFKAKIARAQLSGCLQRVSSPHRKLCIVKVGRMDRY